MSDQKIEVTPIEGFQGKLVVPRAPFVSEFTPNGGLLGGIITDMVQGGYVIKQIFCTEKGFTVLGQDIETLGQPVPQDEAPPKEG